VLDRQLADLEASYCLIVKQKEDQILKNQQLEKEVSTLNGQLQKIAAEKPSNATKIQ
jgi:hypothetical protein